jgi:tetratricopeptide (TPR) repeat protein
MRLLRTVLAGVLVLALAGLTWAQDIVTYKNHATKKDDDFRGTIEEEGPGGVKIKVKEGKGTAVKEVKTGDIVSIYYQTNEVDKLSFKQPFGKQELAKRSSKAKRGELLTQATELYGKVRDQLVSRPPARRYIEFKLAEVAVMQAEDDPTKVDAAIKLLSDFKSSHGGSWEIVPALKTLARLQEDTGRSDDARKTYEELAEVPGVPPELKQESEILVGRLLLRGGRFADAEKKLEKLAAALSAGDPQRPFVQLYLLESQIGQDKKEGLEKQLHEVIRGNSDARLRGTAYNLLGDFYRKSSRPQDAFWSYLRVDAMYNEDPEEQAKALYYLSQLFDKEKKDPIRGKECAARLEDKRFAGTTYQKLQKTEKK